jgi:putative protease
MSEKVSVLIRDKPFPKILSPIRSYEGAVKVIHAGADELYCNVTMQGIKHFQFYRGSACDVSTYTELSRIVKYAHDQDVKVYVTVNIPLITSTIKKELKKHVFRCQDEGIDALIVGNLGLLTMLKKMRVNVPFFASTFLASLNYEAVRFLKKLGFSRVILERQLLIDEISEITQLCEIEVEVFIHGGGCSNINANCFLLHLNHPALFQALSTINGLNPPCRLPFEIYDANAEEKKIDETAVLDAYTFCSLCKLPELLQTGVTGFKIVGRCLNEAYQKETTKVYRKCINLIKKGQIKAFEKKLVSLKKTFLPLPPSLPTLQEYCCEQKRCYYSPLFHTPYKLPVSWHSWLKFDSKKSLLKFEE